jgi:hypothetical protein
MDRRYSPINDLYGATPEDESPKKRRHVFLFVLLALAGVFVYNSIRLVMRLRPDPPPAVVGARLNPGEAAYRSQERMARACWDYAIESVQKDYPYGQGLPNNPPPGSNNRTGKPSAISTLCWPRLRLVWTRRESWVRSYEWDTDWITDPRGSLQRTLHDILKFLDVTH